MARCTRFMVRLQPNTNPHDTWTYDFSVKVQPFLWFQQQKEKEKNVQFVCHELFVESSQFLEEDGDKKSNISEKDWLSCLDQKTHTVPWQVLRLQNYFSVPFPILRATPRLIISCSHRKVNTNDVRQLKFLLHMLYNEDTFEIQKHNRLVSFSLSTDTLESGGFGWLKDWKHLQCLNLSCCSIDSYDQHLLQYLSNLTQLSLCATPISDISSLQYLQRLKHVDLSNSKVVSILPLMSSRKTLLSLDLTSTAVRDLDQLRGCKNLARLILRSCRQNEWSFLKELPFLVYLDARNLCSNFAKITYSELSQCHRLVHLNLSNTYKSCDSSGFSFLSSIGDQLEYLNLEATGFGYAGKNPNLDFSFLSSMRHMRHLCLSPCAFGLSTRKCHCLSCIVLGQYYHTPFDQIDFSDRYQFLYEMPKLESLSRIPGEFLKNELDKFEDRLQSGVLQQHPNLRVIEIFWDSTLTDGTRISFVDIARRFEVYLPQVFLMQSTKDSYSTTFIPDFPFRTTFPTRLAIYFGLQEEWNMIQDIIHVLHEHYQRETVENKVNEEDEDKQQQQQQQQLVISNLTGTCEDVHHISHTTPLTTTTTTGTTLSLEVAFALVVLERIVSPALFVLLHSVFHKQ